MYPRVVAEVNSVSFRSQMTNTHVTSKSQGCSLFVEKIVEEMLGICLVKAGQILGKVSGK